jgi:7,8-dihydro-6-hydroxymethylpterin-pyrophosphokinase
MDKVLKIEVYRGPFCGYSWSRPFRQAITFKRTIDVNILIFVHNSFPKQTYIPSNRMKSRGKWHFAISRIIELQKAVDGIE